MAGSDAHDLVKNCTVASPASATVVTVEERTEMLPDHEPAAAAAETEEEVGDESPAAPAAAEGESKKMWRVPQEQVDFILSWGVEADDAPNLGRIDRLPFSDEEKAVYRAGELKGVAARNKLRQIMRDTQRWIRDLLEKHGDVVIDERHRLDAPFKSNSSS